MTKIYIPFSESDLEDLQAGEVFDWNFDGIEVHLFKGMGLCARCSEDIETDGEEDLCPDCTKLK